jgi:single-strand DNA-binding protein
VVGLNKIMVIGNVGTDPEMRYTPSGAPVTSFRIAASRSYNTREGERRQETEWFTVVAWNALAEQVNQYLSKGRRAYVDGRLRSHSYQGNDGQMRFRNEIIADRVLFLDRPGAGDEGGEYSGGSYGQSTGGGYDAGPDVLSPDDLPF